MKSDSSNSSAESGDSGLGLKVRMIQLKRGNNPGFNKIIKEVPSLSKSSWEHNNLLVSGQTTSTNMPVKSIGKDLEIKNSRKVTSETSPQTKYLTMTSLRADFPAKVFPLLEGVKVFKTSQGELFSSRSAVSLEIKDQATYCLRMLKDYFLTTTADLSQLYCFHWMNLGTMSNGRCSTLNIGCPRTAKGSLSSVLEEKVDEKYYLSKKMIDFLIKNNTNEFDGRFKFKGALSENDISFSLTARYWKMGKTDPYIKDKEIRRLTPTECERLQGFPDNWTDGVSDTQRYKQMGNAVSVPVIKAIRKSLMRIFENRESQIT